MSFFMKNCLLYQKKYVFSYIPDLLFLMTNSLYEQKMETDVSILGLPFVNNSIYL